MFHLQGKFNILWSAIELAPLNSLGEEGRGGGGGGRERLSFKRRNIDLRYFSQVPFDRVHIFPRDRGCGCNPPAQDLHRKVKKKKKKRSPPKCQGTPSDRNFILLGCVLCSFLLILSLSLPTGESENLMWPFIQPSSVRCRQGKIDFRMCEVFLCFIVDSICTGGGGGSCDRLLCAVS